MLCIILSIRREVLEKWKQELGPDATYNNLIKAFEHASHKDYAEFVKDLLMKNVPRDPGNFNSLRDNTPPPPSTEQPSPVFPPKSESPSYAAASRVKLREEDNQLGTK